MQTKKTILPLLVALLATLLVGRGAILGVEARPLHTVGTTAERRHRTTGAVLFCSRAADPIDRLVFFGESTTAHLRTTGVLKDGKNTAQVLSPASNTMLLSRRTPDLLLLDPAGGECSLRQYVAREAPDCLVLSFGLNGVTRFAANPEDYLDCYRALCKAVLEASPSTHILLQTVYPVAREPLDWQFSMPPTEINRMLSILNATLPTLAAEDARITLVDTASAITDAEGFLPDTFTTDGIHLTKEAYREILAVLREMLKGALSSQNQTVSKERNSL